MMALQGAAMTGRDDIAARVTALADRLDRGPSVSDGYAAGTTHFHESVRVAFNHHLKPRKTAALR